MKKNKPFVAILMGSENDLSVMKSTIDVLQDLKIAIEVNVLSAHRTPDLTAQYIQDAEQRGCAVFVAAAGLAAHLAGMVAAHTLKPVIGVPLNAGTLGGLDALLATVQMPGGVPVASMAIGLPGATNAGHFAAQIIALQDETILQRLVTLRQNKRKHLETANKTLKQQFQNV